MKIERSIHHGIESWAADPCEGYETDEIIDRRMTAGETWESCLQEIRDLPAVKKFGEDVQVSMYMYENKTAR